MSFYLEFRRCDTGVEFRYGSYCTSDPGFSISEPASVSTQGQYTSEFQCEDMVYGTVTMYIVCRRGARALPYTCACTCIHDSDTMIISYRHGLLAARVRVRNKVRDRVKGCSVWAIGGTCGVVSGTCTHRVKGRRVGAIGSSGIARSTCTCMHVYTYM